MSPHLWDLLERAARGGFVLDGEAGAQFAPRVRHLAGRLVAEGFANGDRLLIHTPKNGDQVAWLWAAGLAGGLGVIVPPRLKDDQVRHLVEDAQPFAVVAHPDRDLLLRDSSRVWKDQRTWRSMEDLAPAAPLGAPVHADPDAPCILLYSSGSTGPPKAIVQRHRTLVDGARIVSGYVGMSATDHVLGLLALSFDYGLNQVLAAAWAGCAVTLRDYLGAADLLSAVDTLGVTVVAGVPTVWRDVAAHLGAAGGGAVEAGPTSLRVLTNSGGRWMPDDIGVLRAGFPDAALHSMYGLTEAFRSAALPPGEIDGWGDSIGWAVPEVELLLVDLESGDVVHGAGEGELVHVGAFVGLGYWNRPEATAARFRPAPDGRPAVWSGDRVRRDGLGRLYFEGRLDGQLKVDGHRVSPDEVVDAVLRHCEGVGTAWVVGVPDGARGHRLVLFVVAAGALDEALRAEAVRRQCRGALPPHLVPAEIRVLDALPRTPHGKVDGAALRRAAEGAP